MRTAAIVALVLYGAYCAAELYEIGIDAPPRGSPALRVLNFCASVAVVAALVWVAA
jgi:hypothetical protein